MRAMRTASTGGRGVGCVSFALQKEKGESAVESGDLLDASVEILNREHTVLH